MKLNQILTKTTFLGTLAIAAGLSTQAVNAQTTLFSSTNSIVGTFSTAGQEVGDEIILNDNGYGSTITDFQFEFYATNLTANATLSVYFYANTGASYNGAASPNTTPIWSDSFAVTNEPGGALVEEAIGNDLPAGGVLVPSDFTWAIELTGLTGTGADGGPLLTTNTTDIGNNVGQNYTDYWLNQGTVDAPSWILATNADYAINFGAVAIGTAVTPEPSSMALMGLGVAGMVGFLKRKSKRS